MSGLLRGGGGVARAADLVEVVLALGVDHLIPMVDYNPFTAAMFDVYMVYGTVLCGVVVIIRTFWGLAWNFIGPSLLSTTAGPPASEGR